MANLSAVCVYFYALYCHLKPLSLQGYREAGEIFCFFLLLHSCVRLVVRYEFYELYCRLIMLFKVPAV